MDRAIQIKMTSDQFETLRDMLCAKYAPKLRDYEKAAIRDLLNQFHAKMQESRQ